MGVKRCTNWLHRTGLHGLLVGRCIHLLFKANAMPAIENRPTSKPRALFRSRLLPISAAWCEGFLEASGTFLIHDETMLAIVDEWISNLSAEHFTQQLAPLRRTFSTFSRGRNAVRLENELRVGKRKRLRNCALKSFDTRSRRSRSFPLLAQLLGLSYAPVGSGEPS